MMSPADDEQPWRCPMLLYGKRCRRKLHLGVDHSPMRDYCLVGSPWLRCLVGSPWLRVVKSIGGVVSGKS